MQNMLTHFYALNFMFYVETSQSFLKTNKTHIHVKFQ